MTIIIGALASAALDACTDDSVGSSGDNDCVSSYVDLGSAPTWHGLKRTMLDSTDWGRVASIRIQEKGEDVGVGDQVAIRVVDLLGRNGRRLAQVEVWRTDDGGWQAGRWSQCID